MNSKTINRNFNRTKIVATVGPASSSMEKLEALILAGVDVFRLNFSHGSHEQKQAILDNIYQLNRENDFKVGVLADLQGPKIRLGTVKNDSFDIEEGDEITFTTEKVEGTKENLYISYQNFPKDVKAGERILLDDGKVGMEIIESDGATMVKAKVIFGNNISSNKGVNLPQTNISIPSLTEKDRKDLAFILNTNVNWIALSFVRSADDIKELKSIINANDSNALVIAKIEKAEAVAFIDDIIEESDGIMVARGDLGVEVPIERMPLIQKDIVKRCINAAKPVIIATQMMESMMESPSPTRAEVTDVANAVIDGADALMLSGETAVGKYPIKVIETMDKIMMRIEKQEIIYNRNVHADPGSARFLSDAICYNACKISESVNAKAILGNTVSGYTAFMISSYRPKANIHIFTPVRQMLYTMSLIWGVRAFYYDSDSSTDQSFADVKEILIAKELIKTGDIIINTASMPLAERGTTNMLKISKVE